MGPRYGEINARGERYTGPTRESRATNAAVGLVAGGVGAGALSQVPKTNRGAARQLGKFGAADAEAKLVGAGYVKERKFYDAKQKVRNKALRENKAAGSMKVTVPLRSIKPVMPDDLKKVVRRRGKHAVKEQAFKLKSRNLKVAGAVGLVGAAIAGKKAVSGLKREDFKLPKREGKAPVEAAPVAAVPSKVDSGPDPEVQEVVKPDGSVTHELVKPKPPVMDHPEVKAAAGRLRRVDKQRLAEGVGKSSDRDDRNLHAANTAGSAIFAGGFARGALRSTSKKALAGNAAAAGTLGVGAVLSAKAARDARKRQLKAVNRSQ